MPDFSMLFLGMAAFFGTHLIGVLPLGDRLRDIVGRNAYRALHSLLSLAGLVFIVIGYRKAPFEPIFWHPPLWAEYLPFLLMPFAVILLVGSYLSQDTKRITRHPMLWAVALWAGTHLAANGAASDLALFGGFLVFALVMQPLADRKTARRDPESWRMLKAQTSLLPFAAILAGRAGERVGDFWINGVLYGLMVFVAAVIVHATILGIAVAPGFPG